jgi:hypothetical protein
VCACLYIREIYVCKYIYVYISVHNSLDVAANVNDLSAINKKLDMNFARQSCHFTFYKNTTFTQVGFLFEYLFLYQVFGPLIIKYCNSYHSYLKLHMADTLVLGLH